MSERTEKLTGLLLFIFICGIVVFASLFVNDAKCTDKYRQLNISGNNLLPGESYVDFCGFNESEELSEVNLAEVKSKFEEHKYIKKADVKFDGIDCIEVILYEKNIKAAFLKDNKLTLVTDKFELLPVYSKTSVQNLPIISEANFSRKSKNSDFIPSEELQEAFKIIDAIKICNPEMYQKLSGLNITPGGNVILTFVNLKCPVIFGRNNTAEKITALNELVKKNIDHGLLKNIQYIDLRYANKIYIGNNQKENTNG